MVYLYETCTGFEKRLTEKIFHFHTATLGSCSNLEGHTVYNEKHLHDHVFFIWLAFYVWTGPVQEE